MYSEYNIHLFVIVIICFVTDCYYSLLSILKLLTRDSESSFLTKWGVKTPMSSYQWWIISSTNKRLKTQCHHSMMTSFVKRCHHNDDDYFRHCSRELKLMFQLNLSTKSYAMTNLTLIVSRTINDFESSFSLNKRLEPRSHHSMMTFPASLSWADDGFSPVDTSTKSYAMINLTAFHPWNYFVIARHLSKIVSSTNVEIWSIDIKIKLISWDSYL